MKQKYFAIIGIIIFFLILMNVNVFHVIELFLQIDLLPLFLSILLLVIVIVLKGVKWCQIIEAHESKLSLKKSIEFILIGFFLSVFTPGRLGDFSRAFYLGKEIDSKADAFSTIIFDRIIDIGLLLILGIFSTLVFIYFFGIEAISIEIALIVGILFLAVVMIFLKQKYAKVLLGLFYRVLIPERYKQKAYLSFKSFYNSVEKAKLHKKQIAISVLTGIVMWAVSITASYALLFSLRIQIPLEFMALVIPLIVMVELLPISISGLGTREATLIFLFSFYYVSPETAIAYSILYMITSYWLLATVGGILFLRNRKIF